MRRYEFSRNLRLLKPPEFSHVFSNASFKGQHKGVLLLARPNDFTLPRLGFVIAKRNVKLACNRNRIKRVIREQFRMQQHTLPAIDIVTIARKPVAVMENDDIIVMINKLFSDLNRQYAKISSPKQV